MKFNTLPILLAGTFLSSSAVAQTVPTIDANYLNGLTGEKVTWQEVTASGEDTVQIGDKYYKYTYHKPDNYTETSEYVWNMSSYTDVTDVVFKYTTSGYRGAIHNFNDNSSIDIKADFIANYTGNNHNTGGAIHNVGSTGNILGYFIGNNGSGNADAEGGAIFNDTYNSSIVIIGNITGDFIGNYASSNNGHAEGGAIYNHNYNSSMATIGNINGDFIGNYASSNDRYVFGGAIYNCGTVGNIIGNFIGNYARSSGGYAFGGAIHNFHERSIGDITGDFIRNYASSNDRYAEGGAIYNDAYNSLPAIIGNITGNFIGNYVYSRNNFAYGGAIYNSGNIGDIKSENIYGNKAISEESIAGGGFLYSNNGTVKSIIVTNVYNNEAQGKSALGGAIFAYIIPSISKYSITIDNNPNYIIGPVYIIQNEKDVKTQNLNGINFDNNKAIAIGGDAIGGAIAFGSSVTLEDNVSSDEIRDGDGNIYGPDGNILTLEEFVKIYTDLIVEESGGFATYEEALSAVGGVNKKSFEIMNTTFTNNVSQADNGAAMGGAVANIGGNGIISNSSFTNNKVIGKTALGGAIYNAGDLTIVADNYQSVFSGNMANDKDNAIYNGNKSVYNTTYDEYYGERYEFTVGNEPSTLLLSAVNGGEIIFNDGIDGDKGYKLTVEGDGEVIVNSTIENVGELNINGGNLTISSAKSNQERRVVLSSISDKTASYSFNKINMVGGNLNFANLVIDEIKTSGLSNTTHRC